MRVAIALMFLCLFGTRAKAQIAQGLFRADDGTAYQVIRLDTGAGLDRLRVTTLGGSVTAVGACSGTQSFPPPTPNAAAAVAGCAIPIQSLHPYGQIVRTAILSPADGTLTFDPSSGGRISLGTGGAQLNVCKYNFDCMGQPNPAALVGLNTTCGGVSAACQAEGVSSACEVNQRSVFAFGLPASGSLPTCNSPGDVTVNTIVGDPEPSDGFSIRTVSGVSQAVVLVYENLANQGFAIGAAGFGISGDAVLNADARVFSAPSPLPPLCNNNGTKDSDEVCDGNDLGGATCADVNGFGPGFDNGFDPGSLSCTASCSFDISGCPLRGSHDDAGSALNGTCSADPVAVTIEAITVAQPQYPGNALGPIPPTGIVDGNRVHIDATIHNAGASAATVEVLFLDEDTGFPLTDGAALDHAEPTLVTLMGGETQVVSFVWDTEGTAWKTNGDPYLGFHTINVAVRQNGSSTDLDSMLAYETVIPKPVLLVHGWNSDALGAWGRDDPLVAPNYGQFFLANHPYWKAYAVGDGQFNVASMNTAITGYAKSIDQNALVLAAYVAGVREQLDAAHVDIVAHSMGGLISRDYIQKFMPNSSDGPVVRNGVVVDPPVVARLLMLGTPNRGSPCVNVLIAALTRSPFASPSVASSQLSDKWIIPVFNRQVTDQRGVKFSVVAGNPLLGAFSCTGDGPGDGVVAVESARHIYVDVPLFDIVHSKMTESYDLFAFFVRTRLTRAEPTTSSFRALSPPALSHAPGVFALADDPQPQFIFAQAVVVPASSSVDIGLFVPPGDGLGLVAFGSPMLTLALTDPSTAPFAVTADSGDPSFTLRSFEVNSPTSGTWTLRLDNSTDTALTAAVGAMLVGGSSSLTLRHAGLAADGSVTITGTLATTGTPVLGAQVTATLVGTDGAPGTINLLDDGLHGDGAASDGIYGASTGSLAADLYTILLHGTAPGIDLYVVGVVGSPPPPSGCPSDSDCDGVLDATDNCSDVANAGQADRDGDGLGDACEPCPIDPQPNCSLTTVPMSNQFMINEPATSANTHKSDSLTWKWLKGVSTATDFGDPRTTDSYMLCIYNGSGTPIFAAAAPAGGTCEAGRSSRPCWKGLGKPTGSQGFKYTNPARTPAGLGSILLKPGPVNARIILKGKGPSLTARANGVPGLPELPLALPLRVQLQASNGHCWEATYGADGTDKNSPTKFSAKGN